MNISYHTWKDFQECPKKYFLIHRKQLKPLVPKNDYHTLYGRLTEKFFQFFCNNWRFTMPYMPPEEIRFKLKVIYDDILKASTVDWATRFATETKDEIFEHSYSDICAVMDSLNQNYFLNTKSEISIEIRTKGSALITGRLDFVHKNPLSQGIVIFDGKGTAKLGKNISEDQLYFYALLYYFHFKILPDELGFFYYRFNTFKPVPITFEILNEFRAKLSLGIKQIMTLGTFNATPGYRACKYCDYQTICIECMEDRAKRKRSSKLEGMPEESGIVDLGF